ncbi:MAG TPA: heparinase II/III family protein [Candidatus Brocadiia bacterium]|nr:heparinase II/III family protein [Candidatus Brocadiia bacterium]
MATLIAAAGAWAGDQVFPLDSSPAAIERLRKSTKFILSLTDEQVRDMVPSATGGVYFTSCPNCKYGAEEAGCFNETWDPRQPKRIVCKGCGEAYPGNPKYRDDKFIEVDAPGGKKHRLHYYERADGYRFWLRAHADYWAREYLEARAAELGDLYRLTNDESCARRAVLILHRFAEVYPGYVYKFDYPFKQKLFVPYTQNRVPGVPEDYRTSRWTWWGYMDISLGLVRAYDRVKAWPGWDGFAGGKGRARVENDLFVPMVSFVLGYPDDGTNMSMTLWRSAICAGRVLGKPEWVHECVARFERLIATKFLYDGHWMETCGSYAQQTQGGLQVVMEAAKGYSDPPGYAHPQTKRRFDDLDLRVLVPGYDRAEEAIAATRLPDNRLLPLNDTWAVHGKVSTARRAKPRERMEPYLLPATSVAVLGGGQGESQVHTWLNYTMGRHHKHSDALSIGLWAHGQELLSDLGYTWSNYRLHWATTTMAHNTVVVNGVDSGRDIQHTRHRLRAFLASPDLEFQLASADATEAAYPGVALLYRRTLILLGAGSGRPVLVDVFQVEGGKQHDYLLHGCRDADSTVTVTGAPLAPFAGTLLNPGIEFRLPQSFQHPNPPGYGFGFIRNLRSGPVRGCVAVDMRLKDNPRTGVRSLLADMPGATLFVGEAPDVRRARDINGDLEKTLAPAVCVRRSGAGLRSIFVAAHEAFGDGRPGLKAVNVRQSSGVICVEIEHESGERDLVLVALGNQASASFRTTAGPLKFSGAFGAVRVSAQSEVLGAWLAGGKSLSLGAVTLAGREGWRGRVTEWARLGVQGHFDVNQRIEAERTGPFILKFADGSIWPFNIVAIEPISGGSRVRVRETPAFEIAGGKTRITAYPQREFAGTRLEFEIMELAAWDCSTGKK